MEDVLVGQVSPGFCEGHDPTAKILKLGQGELPSDRITNNFATAAARTLGYACDLTLEGRVQANCKGGRFHVIHCNTLGAL